MDKYIVSYEDLSRIISSAKQNMSNINLPLHISEKQIEPGEVPSLAVLEAVLTFLSHKKLLNKFISIDYTQYYNDNDMPELEPKEKKKTVIG